MTFRLCWMSHSTWTFSRKADRAEPVQSSAPSSGTGQNNRLWESGSRLTKVVTAFPAPSYSTRLPAKG